MPILVYSTPPEPPGYDWDSFTGDDFTGANGSAPNPIVWTPGGAGSTDIFNNRLRYVITSGVTNHAQIASKFHISGNFDIRVDINGGIGLPSSPLGSETYVWIRSVVDNNDYLLFFIDQNSGGNYYGRVAVNGSVIQQGTVAHGNDFTTRVRIIRTGTKVWIQYDKAVGSSFSTLINNYTWGISDDIRILLSTANYSGNPGYTVYFDNFSIVSGILVPPA